MRGRLAGAATVVMLALALPAAAAEWGDIRPGISTTTSVRAQYGAPSKSTKQKVENYDTETWVYEGPQTPAGLNRLTVEFGLVQSDKYQANIVRAFRIEPLPGGFTRTIINLGWGQPDRVGRDGDTDVFVYLEGLIVYFDDTGQNAKLMLFTVPQPRDPAEEPARR